MTKKTKYIEIKHDIIDKIETGVYKVNDKLPSESELAEHYRVSRHTIRAALTQLEFDDIIKKEQGLGSFVKNKAKKESMTVGVITTYLSEYIFPTINRGIESELTKKGYSMLVASTDNNIDIERQALQMMIEQEVDGLIVEPTKSAYFNPNIGIYLKIQELGIPILMINAQYDELDFPYIAMNDYEAGYTVTKHLVDNNHEYIGGVFKSDDRQGKERIRGFVKACQDCSIEYDSSSVIMYETENQKQVIEDEVTKIINGNKVTALICYNDMIAMDVLKICWKNNLKVPDDLSIISFDNSILSTMSEVKITSVSHPQMSLGQDAAKELIKMIEDESYIFEKIIYPVNLDIKNSIKKL